MPYHNPTSPNPSPNPNPNPPVYQVPASAVDSLVSGPPILCRGSQFVLQRCGDNGTAVVTTFYSPMPEITARSIAEKVHARILDPNPPGMEACSVS